MDLTAIQAAITSLKVAADITKSMREIKADAEIQSKIIEIQSTLLDAQDSAISANSAQHELQGKIRELEAQLKAVDDWVIQKKRYALVTPWQGPAQAYALKRPFPETEESHFLCTNCFHNSKRVILNPSMMGNRILMICPACKATLDTGYRGGKPIDPPKYAEDYQK